MTDMSDIGQEPVDAPAVETTTVEAAPVADSPTETAPVVSDEERSALDLELPAGMQQFDRAYVEKLRREAATHRTKAREQAEQLQRFSAFDGYDDNDMQIWQQMASDWKSGDYPAAAATMQQIAQSVLGDPTATEAERAEAQEVLDDPTISAAAESLDADAVRNIVRDETAAQETERKTAEAVQQINATVAAAGFAEGSADHFAVLWRAANETGGDIDAAIKAQKDSQQQVIDNYVASLASGGSPVRMPSAGMAGTPMTEPPTNLQDARKQADAWLRERQSQG